MQVEQPHSPSPIAPSVPPLPRAPSPPPLANDDEPELDPLQAKLDSLLSYAQRMHIPDPCLRATEETDTADNGDYEVGENDDDEPTVDDETWIKMLTQETKVVDLQRDPSSRYAHPVPSLPSTKPRRVCFHESVLVRVTWSPAEYPRGDRASILRAERLQTAAEWADAAAHARVAARHRKGSVDRMLEMAMEARAKDEAQKRKESGAAGVSAGNPGAGAAMSGSGFVPSVPGVFEMAGFATVVAGMLGKWRSRSVSAGSEVSATSSSASAPTTTSSTTATTPRLHPLNTPRQRATPRRENSLGPEAKAALAAARKAAEESRATSPTDDIPPEPLPVTGRRAQSEPGLSGKIVPTASRVSSASRVEMVPPSSPPPRTASISTATSPVPASPGPDSPPPTPVRGPVRRLRRDSFGTVGASGSGSGGGMGLDTTGALDALEKLGRFGKSMAWGAGAVGAYMT
ncbi:hypothetical protein M427DRAFT_52015 [Gonapodya prolifera JEL478]|uniref:Uncharacterized protein n=1 Tax=Gonapodya prolifera (strain JEL478) TaxID=1344416 RepID=A0A139AUH1_GONPJ|nr:hypothetical protein M427DRAFT_52015 [Gonapodya prolifera JEL478]|eukprot:KXS20368.1 hypothetical protein M427DRAFT_52015 [Gonapodya prolifera JEL478]